MIRAGLRIRNNDIVIDYFFDGDRFVDILDDISSMTEYRYKDYNDFLKYIDNTLDEYSGEVLEDGFDMVDGIDYTFSVDFIENQSQGDRIIFEFRTHYFSYCNDKNEFNKWAKMVSEAHRFPVMTTAS